MQKRRVPYTAPYVESIVIQSHLSLLRRNSLGASVDTIFLELDDDDTSLFDEIMDNGDF